MAPHDLRLNMYSVLLVLTRGPHYLALATPYRLDIAEFPYPLSLAYIAPSFFGVSDCNPGIELPIPGSGIEKLLIPGSSFGIRLTVAAVARKNVQVLRTLQFAHIFNKCRTKHVIRYLFLNFHTECLHKSVNKKTYCESCS